MELPKPWRTVSPGTPWLPGPASRRQDRGELACRSGVWKKAWTISGADPNPDAHLSGQATPEWRRSPTSPHRLSTSSIIDPVPRLPFIIVFAPTPPIVGSYHNEFPPSANEKYIDRDTIRPPDSHDSTSHIAAMASTAKYTAAPQDDPDAYTQPPPSYQAESSSAQDDALLFGGAPRNSEGEVPDDFKVRTPLKPTPASFSC